MNTIHPKDERDYVAVAHYGLIGNLRTAALVSIDGSVDSYCVPNFDSPSVFARILDKEKGGHFSITPTIPFTSKQNYLPSSNVLQTKFMNDAGVVSVTDFLPRPRKDLATQTVPSAFLPWLVRRIECIRGRMPILIQCAPAFNYARSSHTTSIVPDDSIPAPSQNMKAFFKSDDLELDLRYVAESTATVDGGPDTVEVPLELLDLSEKGHKGPAVQSSIVLVEGQVLSFILRTPPTGGDAAAKAPQPDSTRGGEPRMTRLPRMALDDPPLTNELISTILHNTNRYWYEWISQSTYTGSWKEHVHRSALALKLLIYEPTGAVVASPTFSLPEYIGGGGNWDYRALWIRDSSFTLYALIRLGFTEEANSYLKFIFERLRDKNPDGSLQISYSIHGGKDLEETELDHLDGHKGSRPVRIGNSAANHVQLDIYGALMDCIYLGQKYGKPLNYDDWVLVRDLVDFVVAHRGDLDYSIWEVRDKLRHFTYTKVMLWVAIDRGLRLADKRSLPCPNRSKWLQARDELYEDIMHKAWNEEGKFFGQSYEDNDVLDAAVLVMPLVFFMNGSDPRFLNTLRKILQTPDRGGLTSNGLLYRYDLRQLREGTGREEGTFCLCTLWCIEALTRASENERTLLPKAVTMFEDFLLYLNHVWLCTEEISEAGEALGNAVKGLTHVTLISAAYHLSRTLGKSKAL